MATNAKEEKKPGIVSRIGRSFRDMRGELKRVVWPSRKQIINNTLIVLAFMLLAAVIIGAFDTIVSLLLSLFFGTGA